jgi:hypothetical protein
VSSYLTIPEVTDYEPLVSLNRGSSDKSFEIVVNAGQTAMWLWRTAADGRVIPLVVVATDGPMLALDDVVVAVATAGASEGDPYMAFTLDAREVRTA